MGLNIEITWDQPITVGLLEQFINHAKAGGASADTPVQDITDDQDSQIQLGWRVPINGAGAVSREVAMPHRLMWNLHNMLDQIANSDGDVRSLQSEVMDLDVELWQALMKHVGD